MSQKPKVKITADGRYRPLLTYGDGVNKVYGSKTTAFLAFRRAKKAFDAWRYRVLVVKGMIREHDERMAEYEKTRPLRAIYA